MEITSYLLGKKSSGGGGGSGGLDWSAIGYETTPQGVDEGYNYAKNIYDNWENISVLSSMFTEDINLTIMPLVDTSNATTMSSMFQFCYGLTSVPLLNTSKCTNFQSSFASCYCLKTIPKFDTANATNMSTMFNACSILKNVPQFDTSKVTSIQNMFYTCNALTDESLNNILKMCININPSYSKTRTLAYLGFRSTYYPASRIQALSSYEDFIDAGWTIGY